MKAVYWHGSHIIRVDEVPEPRILHLHDAIVKITLTAICGSDLSRHSGFRQTGRLHYASAFRHVGRAALSQFPEFTEG
jgi:threonine dehydrogenase-like Zn-dependent dehydrogenase